MAARPKEAPGITRDCFLDCGQAKTSTASELQAAQHCGQASASFLARVLEEIEQRATTLTTGQRKSITEVLRKAIP